MLPRFEREKPKRWDGRKLHPEAIVQQKLDGWRVLISASESDVEVRFRKETIALDLISAKQWFARLKHYMLPGSAIEGELFHPFRPASDVKSLVLAGSDELVFQPFAVPFYRGMDLRRQNAAEHYEGILKPMMDPEYPVWTQYHGRYSLESYEQCAKDNGWEGIVIRERAYELWWKVKVSHTVDAVVTGIKPGYGKYRGQCGALIVAQWDGEDWREIASCSGMSDDVRAAITQADVGRVVEIKHNGWMSKGRLRHPNFIRWRDDKPFEECVYDG